MNIGKQVRVKGRWHLAVVDRENCEGSILYPIVAWFIVEGSIVPFVSDPSRATDRLVAALEYGDDLVGIVSPEETNDRWWDDQANVILDLERDEESKPAKDRAS
jgi:hypothetical protein